MKTQETTRVSPVESRVRRFYECLNAGQFRDCFEMIDPSIREDPHSVTLYQYMQSLGSFLKYYGSVQVLEVELHVHANEPSVRFRNRDFAIGKSSWKDQREGAHIFQERWVKNDSDWYTVATGFVTPDGAVTPHPPAP